MKENSDFNNLMNIFVYSLIIIQFVYLKNISSCKSCFHCSKLAEKNQSFISFDSFDGSEEIFWRAKTISREDSSSFPFVWLVEAW